MDLGTSAQCPNFQHQPKDFHLKHMSSMVNYSEQSLFGINLKEIFKGRLGTSVLLIQTVDFQTNF